MSALFQNPVACFFLGVIAGMVALMVLASWMFPHAACGQ